ncbi:MAG: DUF4360 domain-containing protein [Bdellovibrionaceae bacterium]|nr:DUF4360 domain-containing protein [Pseudobdellovibrionaceae bacterium]
MTSQKVKLFLVLSTLILACVAEAGDRERPMRRGRPDRRGNEASQVVSQITVGVPSYGGNACPQGSVKAVFAADNLSFSLLFDQFVAEVTDPAAAPRDSISCDVLIPIQVPEGMQMKITRVDLRGFSSLPEWGRGFLHSVFNFRGRGGDGDRMNLRFAFAGPIAENYELSSDTLTPGDSEISPCGGAFQLRILNQLRIQIPQRGSQATLTLDSVDGTSEATYFVGWQSCEKQEMRPPRRR